MKLKGGYKDRAIKPKDIVPNECVTVAYNVVTKVSKSFAFIVVFRYVSKVLIFTGFNALNDTEPDVFHIRETISLKIEYVMHLLKAIPVLLEKHHILTDLLYCLSP